VKRGAATVLPAAAAGRPPYSAGVNEPARLGCSKRYFQYSVGVERASYYEETLVEETAETLGAHEFSITFDQRER
jgi:hypothetical protein